MRSIERVKKLLKGELPDRPPIHDLIVNDAVLEYFGREKITFGNAEKVIFGALPQILDSTRPYNFLPEKERVEITRDGRKREVRRWTEWVEHVKYKGFGDYVTKKKKLIEENWDWSEKDAVCLKKYLEEGQALQKRLGDIFLFWGDIPLYGSESLMGLYCEIGLEQFSYFMVDSPQIISELIKFHTEKAIQFIEHLPVDKMNIEGIFVGQDIAFKTNTIFSVSFMKKDFFPGLAKIINKLHEKGIKVMFHSDGNLMSIMDILVDYGIDLINPFEVLAGMSVEKVHKLYPHLIIAGGIDVSQLLPYGTQEEIKETVKKTIEITEGKIMIGSSTELQNSVPLENFLAMYEAVHEYKF